MDPQQIVDIVNKYGFPIVAAVGMGYFIYFINAYVTSTLATLISEIHTTLVALIDRIRMLDNDLIRFEQKVNVVLQIKDEHSDYKSKN